MATLIDSTFDCGPVGSYNTILPQRELVGGPQKCLSEWGSVRGVSHPHPFRVLEGCHEREICEPLQLPGISIDGGRIILYLIWFILPTNCGDSTPF